MSPAIEQVHTSLWARPWTAPIVQGGADGMSPRQKGGRLTEADIDHWGSARQTEKRVAPQRIAVQESGEKGGSRGTVHAGTLRQAITGGSPVVTLAAFVASDAPNAKATGSATPAT